MTGSKLKDLFVWFFRMTEDDHRASEALGAVLVKDLIFRIGIELVLVLLWALCGQVEFALIWLALVVPAEFGEVVLEQLKKRDKNPGDGYLYGQFFVSLFGGGTWAGGGVYLWSTGDIVMMASGLLMIVGVTAHVTFKYSDWIKGAIVAAIPPMTGLFALAIMPMPFEMSVPERILIVVAIGGLIYYMLIVAVADVQKQIQLKQALNAASEASRTKSIFLANMSHEIRTPMNGVLGMAEMLGRTGLEDDQKEMVSVIRSSGDALIGVIDDILDLSKIEAGHLELDHQAFWIHDLVRNLVITSELMAHAKGLEFRLVWKEDRPLCVEGDVLRLRQIVGNLLSNAIKFTEDGVVTLAVTADVNEQKGVCGLSFAVADTGSGLSDDDQARIFEPFVQVDDSLSRRHGGSGLGLSISHRIAAMMNGSLGVRSKKGEGAEFSFFCELPMVEDCEAASEIDIEDTTGDVEPTHGHRPRILVAEDHAHNRRVLQLMLATMSVDVCFVEDGRKAVEAYEAGEFDLLLLDIQMPELTGVEALAEIRRIDAERRHPAVPALALTANAMKHQVDEYISAGFNGHVAKPIVVETLVNTMNDALTNAG